MVIRASKILFVAAAIWAAQPALAHEFEYTAVLTGSSVSPPNASPAIGSVLVTLDLDVITMHVEASFSGLSSGATAATIHGVTLTPLTGTAGVASLNPTLPGFPLGVTAGTYDHTIDLTQASGYSPAFITASGGMVSDALNALIFGMADEKMYFEIDSTNFPGGEIRGFLTPVPEPASMGMVLAAVGLLVRPRRK